LQVLPITPAFDASVGILPQGPYTRWCKKFETKFIRFDIIHEYDRHMDGKTPHDATGRAYA